MRASIALKRLQEILVKVSDVGFIPTSEIDGDLLKWLEEERDGFAVFNSSKLKTMIESRVDGISRSDTEMVEALEEAVHSLKWEIRYLELLCWVCGIGMVVVIGSIWENLSPVLDKIFK